ncbi:MAG: ribonuclease D [Actinomycetota bacterium]
MTKQTAYSEPVLVKRRDALDQIVDESRDGGLVAIDTEFMREKTYRARLCLVQVATRNNLYIIDPLDVPDLKPVAELLPDPEVELIVHAGRQDFEIFFERYGTLPKRMFDVQLAAGFAGFGASLPYGRLVESITGTTLTKGESYTDWCRRPLTAAQMTYAADDVRYLPVVRDVLRDKLSAAGRLGWVEDEMSMLEDPGLYATDAAEVWRRVSGRGKMSGKQTAILRELARWREETASRRDIPRGWVVKDQTLLEIARRGPRSVAELKNIRGFPAKESDRSGREILAAVETGRASEPLGSAEGPSRTAQVRARTLSGLADAIVRSRADAAGVATELVSTRGELESFLADLFDGGADERRHRLLRGWRRELAGEAVMDLAGGRIAVRSIDRSPYIEEVPLKD